jgi:hypothetical protein
MCSRLYLLIGVALLTVQPRELHADLITYGYQDRDAWITDAGVLGTIETITFTEYPIGRLTTQYEESHGLTFTGSGFVQIAAFDLSFPLDGRGLLCIAGDAILTFDRPMLALAADFPGTFTVEFFSDDVLLGSSPFDGPGGPGNFSGVISTDPFNVVRISDSDSDFGIDDLHFVAVPAPSMLLPFAAGLVLLGGRRRRR